MISGCRVGRLRNRISLPGAVLLLAAAATPGVPDAAAAPTAGASRPTSAVLIDLQQAVRNVAESVTPAVVKLDTVAAGQARADRRPNLMPVPGVGSGGAGAP